MRDMAKQKSRAAASSKKPTKPIGLESTRTGTISTSTSTINTASVTNLEKKKLSMKSNTSTYNVSITSDLSAPSAEKKRRGPFRLFQRHKLDHGVVPATIQTINGNPQSAPAATLTSESEAKIAIEKIQHCIAQQEKHEENLKVKMNSLCLKAQVKLALGERTAALYDMKLKKNYEHELDKLQNVKFTLETQIMKIESHIENMAMYEALVAGSSTMKKIQGNLGVDEFDDAMDDIREALEVALEINASLAQDVNPVSLDNDALLAELMENYSRTSEEITGCLVSGVGNPLPPKKISDPPLDLPNVPANKIVTLSDDNAMVC